MVLEELPDGCLADVCSALGPEALSALTATSQSLNKLVLQLLDEVGRAFGVIATCMFSADWPSACDAKWSPWFRKRDATGLLSA